MMDRVSNEGFVPINIAKSLLQGLPSDYTKFHLNKDKVEAKTIVQKLEELIVSKDAVLKSIDLAVDRFTLDRIFRQAVLNAFIALGVLETRSRYSRPKNETQINTYYLSPSLGIDVSLDFSPASYKGYLLSDKQTTQALRKDIPILLQQAHELTKKLKESGLIES